jgi:hypothetical protein
VTGDQIVARALVELQSEATRPLEGGTTLGDFLEDSLNFAIGDVFSAWPWEWAQSMSVPIPTANGQMDYVLPTNMADIINIIDNVGSIETRMLNKMPLRTFKQKWAAQSYLPADKPQDYARLNDTQFRLAPTPNSVYNLTIEGTIQPSTIVNFTLPVTAIPERYHESLVYGVSYRGAEALKDQQAQARFEQQFGKQIGKMITDDKRQPDTNFELQPFYASGQIYQTAYWANPFVRTVR